jgi:hypothetical protein
VGREKGHCDTGSGRGRPIRITSIAARIPSAYLDPRVSFPGAVEKLTEDKSEQIFNSVRMTTNDSLCSARHFLSPNLSLISEISNFSTPRLGHVNDRVYTSS